MPKLLKIGDSYYNMGTSNSSFLKAAETFKEHGMEDYYFMLRIDDLSLLDIDPKKVDSKGNSLLLPEQQAAIIKECQNNYWYYLREVVGIQFTPTAIREMKMLMHQKLI